MELFGMDGKPLLIGSMEDLARRVGGRDKVGQHEFLAELPAEEVPEEVRRRLADTERPSGGG